MTDQPPDRSAIDTAFDALCRLSMAGSERVTPSDVSDRSGLSGAQTAAALEYLRTAGLAKLDAGLWRVVEYAKTWD